MQVLLDQKLTWCKKLATVCQMTFGQSAEKSVLHINALEIVRPVSVHTSGPCSLTCQIQKLIGLFRRSSDKPVPWGLYTPLGSEYTLPFHCGRQGSRAAKAVGGKDPLSLFSPCLFWCFAFYPVFPCLEQLAWLVYTHACARTNAGAAVYFIFVVYVCSGKRTHGALHVLMKKPVENK